ncbi:MAG TPA: SRPBCC family protein [Thermoguttaceae bacterium]|nr:SRPBCC family protein [Thermoguttaceae bacterium]
MRLKESIHINTPPDVVWQYVGSPDVWSLFHAKARDTRLVSGQGGLIGSRYEMQLSLGSKKALSTGQIIDIQIGRLIRLKSTLEPEPGREVSAMLTYELRDLGTWTKVYEQIDIDDPHINPFFRAIIWLITRLGKPRGETSLMKLKRIIEEDA